MAANDRIPRVTFRLPEQQDQPITPPAATDHRVTFRLPEHDGTTPDTYIHPLDILIACASRVHDKFRIITSTPSMTAAHDRIPRVTFRLPKQEPKTPAAATDRWITFRVPEEDPTTPAGSTERWETFRVPEQAATTPDGGTYLHPLASLITRASSMISSLSTFCHNVAVFCNQGWWVIKTAITPSPMTTLALAASFPFFLYGYDVASSRWADAVWHDLNLTHSEVSLYATYTDRLSYAVGAFVAGVAANRYGRKYLFVVGGIVYIIGALVKAFTTSFFASSLGRAAGGFGVGMGLLVGPIYIAETAPSTTRGYHGTFPQLLIAVGSMVAYALELALVRAPRHVAWRVMVGAVTLPTGLFTYFVFSRRFSDTPCWLMMIGQVRLAEQLMEQCGATGKEPWDRREQLEHVAGFPYRSVVDPRRVDLFPGRITGFWAHVSDRLGSQFRDVSAVTVLLVAQEAACEQMAIRYALVALTRNGFGSVHTYSGVLLVLSFAKLVATTSSLHGAQRSMEGRRRMVLGGMVLAGCSLGFLAGTSFADAHDHIGRGVAVVLLCVETIALQTALGLALGPIPWMYGPEVFPLAVRAPSVGLCLAFKFLFTTFFNWTFDGFGLFSTVDTVWLSFLLAFGLIVVSFLVSFGLVRETTFRLLMDDP